MKTDHIIESLIRSLSVRIIRKTVGRQLYRSYWQIKKVKRISKGSILEFKKTMPAVGRNGLDRCRRGGKKGAIPEDGLIIDTLLHNFVLENLTLN